MSRKTSVVHNNLIRTLQPYAESDGPYISLPVLKDTLPNHRWDLYLLGLNGTNKSGAVMRTQPLLGRTISKGRVVVLVSSLIEWLMHYNPDKPVTVMGMVDGLKLAEKRYRAGLQLLRAEVSAKSGTRPGRVATPKVAKATRHVVPKATSNELWRVW